MSCPSCRPSSPSPRWWTRRPPGGSSSSRSSATTWTSAARTRSPWSSPAGAGASAVRHAGPVPHPRHHQRGGPSQHFDYKHTKIKQYHKLGRALRTQTAINDAPADFGIPKRLTGLPALRQIGFAANRRLLGVQTISHDPIRGARAFTALTAPLITPAGTRIPGLRLGDPRAHALLQALLIHRLLPRGFTNRELRTLIAPLLGATPSHHAGKMTYDLRRLREHGLIARIPHTRRYQVTDTGLHDALLFTHAHDHLLRPGLAQTADPSPPAPAKLRAAARAYQAAYDDLARQAHLAA